MHKEELEQENEQAINLQFFEDIKTSLTEIKRISERRKELDAKKKEIRKAYADTVTAILKESGFTDFTVEASKKKVVINITSFGKSSTVVFYLHDTDLVMAIAKNDQNPYGGCYRDEDDDYDERDCYDDYDYGDEDPHEHRQRIAYAHNVGIDFLRGTININNAELFIEGGKQVDAEKLISVLKEDLTKVGQITQLTKTILKDKDIQEIVKESNALKREKDTKKRTFENFKRNIVDPEFLGEDILLPDGLVAVVNQNKYKKICITKRQNGSRVDANTAVRIDFSESPTGSNDVHQQSYFNTVANYLKLG